MKKIIKFSFHLLILLMFYSCSNETELSDSNENDEDFDQETLFNDDALIDITSLNQLNAIRYDLNGDGRPDNNENSDEYYRVFPELDPTLNNYKGFELRNDLDFKDSNSYINNEKVSSYTSFSGWTPIGESYGESDSGGFFNSTLEGNNFSIKNLFIDTGSGNVGLFREIKNSTISNLNLEEVNITALAKYGALACEVFNSNITNCNVSGKFLPAVAIGMEAYIEEELGKRTSGSRGGLIGHIKSEDSESIGETNIVDCSVSISSISVLDGGVIGQLLGDDGNINVKNCYSNGDMYSGGGLIGDSIYFTINSAIIENCYSECNILGFGGGLMRNSGLYSLIKNCYAIGDVGEGGGLIAENKGQILNSFATGNVGGYSIIKRAVGYIGSEAVNIPDGGLVGSYSSSSNINITPIIKNCWSSGTVYARNSDDGVGGLIGVSNGLIENCYTVSDIIVVDGDNYGNLIGVLNDGEVLNCYAVGSIVIDSITTNDNASYVGVLVDGVFKNEYAEGLIINKDNLKLPTSASGIFTSWDSNIWDFGRSTEYPGLIIGTNEINRPL